ncbi:hypothetical protein KEM56_002105 [Ascosphaera pollenicola]|nr:hypothetical protein KEM56_002105 [Ascosphaera pollenicola]
MQGFNMGRYVPPDLEGVQSGNQLHKKHPLGSRARNLHSTGELTVRFEMPFNIWCLNCAPEKGDKRVIICQGVRFNAHKKKVGNYYSTPIWAFRMKHSICGGWIEIRTDPKNTAYVVTEGGERQEKGVLARGEYEEDGVAEIKIRLPGEEEKAKDAFEKLETKVEDKRKFITEQERMKELYRLSDKHWDDPYEQSRKLRRTFRAERKRKEAVEEKDEALKNRMGLAIDLLEETEGDRIRSSTVQFQRAKEMGLLEAAKKPMFDEQADTGSIKKRKRPSAEQVSAERRALFHRELRGNTRAALDPFLAEDSWESAARVKRREKTKEIKDHVVMAPVKASVDISTTNPPTQAEKESAPETAPVPAQSLLVDYGSDSD